MIIQTKKIFNDLIFITYGALIGSVLVSAIFLILLNNQFIKDEIFYIYKNIPTSLDKKQKNYVALTSDYLLAYSLEHGTDRSIDYRLATHYYQKSAESGDVRAQSRLGIAYLKGQLGLPNDFDQAEKWLTEAAIHDDINAQYYLGRLLLRDSEINLIDALIWVAVAAKRGYKPAQYCIKEYWPNLSAQQQDELISRIKKFSIKNTNVIEENNKIIDIESKENFYEYLNNINKNFEINYSEFIKNIEINNFFSKIYSWNISKYLNIIGAIIGSISSLKILVAKIKNG